jgi:predicted nucleotidyltransferase
MIEISNGNKKLSPPDPLIEFFSNGIHKSLDKHLTSLILYGSRARGDAKDYSDYDFLAIVDQKTEEIEDKILDVSVDTLNQFDRITSCLVWEEKDWELKKRFPIGKNIIREGILL